MLETIITTALAVNALFRVPVYNHFTKTRFVNKYDETKFTDEGFYYGEKGYRTEKPFFAFKPFSCLFCMAFWIGLIILILGFKFDTWQLCALHVAIMPLATAFLSEGLNRLFNLLPVKI